MKNLAFLDAICKKSRRNSKTFFFKFGHFIKNGRPIQNFKKREMLRFLHGRIDAICKKPRQNPNSSRCSRPERTDVRTDGKLASPK